jgi:hypothetical protein
MASRKKITYLFLLLFAVLSVHTALHAQEQDEPPIVVDSVSTMHDEGSYESKTPKGDFRNIYDSSIAINAQKKVPDSVMQAILADDDFWYANKTEEEKGQKERIDSSKKNSQKSSNSSNDGFLNSTGASWIMWIILILVMLGAIIVFLMNNQVNLFSSKSKKMVQDATHDGNMPENIFEIEYEAAINKALADGNYRLATRFLFLRTLKMLSSKKIIDYAADKTNFDYLFQVNGSKYYPLFMQVAKNYEYVWYGKFEVDEEQFKAIRNSFDEFHKQLA